MMISIGILVMGMMVAVSAVTPIIPKKYPLFKQCDPRWANDYMGGTGPIDTICAQGCAMSSLSMALNGKGYVVPSAQETDPGTLNAWLRTHGGYVNIGGDPDNLKLDAVDVLAPGKIVFVSEHAKPTATGLQQWIQDELVAIAHVRNRTHFVLLTGYYGHTTDLFTVNDPGFEQSSYTYDEISDILLYKIAEHS